MKLLMTFNTYRHRCQSFNNITFDTSILLCIMFGFWLTGQLVLVLVLKFWSWSGLGLVKHWSWSWSWSDTFGLGLGLGIVSLVLFTRLLNCVFIDEVPGIDRRATRLATDGNCCL